jgi:chromate transporter
VLPFARRMLVERRGWLSPEEFNDVLGLCQFLPGPNIVNVSVAVGARFRGVVGSLAAFLGLMAAPMAIVLALATLYDRFGHIPAAHGAVGAVAAAAAGLVLATGLKMALPFRKLAIGSRFAAAVFLSLTLVAVAVLRVPLLALLLVLAPLSVAVAWRLDVAGQRRLLAGADDGR